MQCISYCFCWFQWVIYLCRFWHLRRLGDRVKEFSWTNYHPHRAVTLRSRVTLIFGQRGCLSEVSNPFLDQTAFWWGHSIILAHLLKDNHRQHQCLRPRFTWLKIYSRGLPKTDLEKLPPNHWSWAFPGTKLPPQEVNQRSKSMMRGLRPKKFTLIKFSPKIWLKIVVPTTVWRTGTGNSRYQ